MWYLNEAFAKQFLLLLNFGLCLYTFSILWLEIFWRLYAIKNYWFKLFSFEVQLKLNESILKENFKFLSIFFIIHNLKLSYFRLTSIIFNQDMGHRWYKKISLLWKIKFSRAHFDCHKAITFIKVSISFEQFVMIILLLLNLFFNELLLLNNLLN